MDLAGIIERPEAHIITLNAFKGAALTNYQLTSQTFDELVVLANGQFSLYNVTALDLAIQYYCAAFDLGPSPDTKTDYTLSYIQFHRASLLCAQRQGDDAVSNRYLDKVLEITPPTHSLRRVLLCIQAALYMKCYERTEDRTHLDLAVGILKTATDGMPAKYPQRINLLMQYGIALYIRYMALKDKDDINLAIRQFELVLEDCPGDMHFHARRSLAFALDARCRLHHDIHEMDLAVNAYVALFKTPQQQQPGKDVAACMGYAMVLWNRFHRKGDLDDLHTAIKYFEVVIEKSTPECRHYFITLTFHASLLICRSEQRKSIEDIDNAIDCIRNGMDASQRDDPSRSLLLSTLGYCLISRFLYCGSTMDLESAVKNCYAAVSLESSIDAGSRACSMTRLAFALFTRYQLQGDMLDSSRAKDYLQKALELCPPLHPNRLCILNNYARISGNIARRDADLSALDLSVKYFFEALKLSLASTQSTILSNLALVLLYRYLITDDPSDVDVAFMACKAALNLRSETHPGRGMTLLIQAKVVIAAFSRTRKTFALVDTEIALDILRAARDAFTRGHPLLIETYGDFSNVYSIRHSITNGSSDLEDAFKYRILAARYPGGGSRVQFEAAMKWVEDAEKFAHPSLLDAYRTAIRTLDFHVVLKPSVDLRHNIIKTQALSICADATSCALRCHDVIGAVEMFEHSRGLFWTFMARLRTPLDELRDSGHNGRVLADEFEIYSRQLETPITIGEDGELGQRFRHIQGNWNAVVDKIRVVDGFSKFLLPPSYEDLRVAAIGGPVIILNASQYSCDAIIVLINTEPIHIAFPENTFNEIVVMSSDFQHVIRTLHHFPIDSNDPEKQRAEKWLAVLLRRLWDSIVCEVVYRLELHVPKNSRIWWCPTGAFTALPVHAAHPYRKGEHGLSDIYVSSYTPTLSALVRSRKKRSAQHGARGFAFIGQPNLAGHELLASVREELSVLRKDLPESVQFTELVGDAATRDAALEALSTHTFVHLACHGDQVPGRPHDSHFAMRDGRLTLLDIVHRQVETEFAFLSACKTATGDVDAPDEVVHLAAALQFAGVRNVVGTMWSVDDCVVVHVVKAFYRAMISEDGMFDPSRAARALRTATGTVKDRVSLDQRIVFIHIGL